MDIILLSFSIIFFKFQSELPGFYDPCAGEGKQLLIEYTYNNVQLTHKIKDQEPLRLPLNDGRNF